MTKKIRILCALLICVFYSFAASPLDSIFSFLPYSSLVMSPADPIVSDPVSLWLMFDEQSTQQAQSYQSSFSITKVQNASNRLPEYIISLSYKPELSHKANTDTVVHTGPYFLLGNLAAGHYTVIDKNHNSDTVDMFSVTTKHHLPQISGTIFRDRGTVASAQRIANCTVYLRQAADRKSFVNSDTLLPASDSTHTDANGNFLFDNIYEGSFRLVFSAKGFVEKDTIVHVPGNENIFVGLLGYNARCSISGNVTEIKSPLQGSSLFSASPLGACTVSVSGITAAGDLFMGKQFSSFTNEAGKFVIDSIPVLSQNRLATVTASKCGYSQETKSVSLFDGENIFVKFNIQPAFVNPETTTVDGVSFVLATEKTVYSRGDSIRARYSLVNNGMGKIVYSFDKDIPYVMVAVTPKQDTVFRFAGNTAKTSRTQIALDPGQSTAIDFPAFAFGDDSLLSISAGMAGYPRSTVSLSASMTDYRLPAQPIKKNVSLSREIITFSASTKTLSIYIPKAQTVSVSAYVVNGQQISQLSRKKFMSAGTHTINLAKSSITNGVIVFRIDGSNFSCVKKINLTNER